MRPLLYSTHRLHPEAEAALEALGDLAFASRLDAETLAREGEVADIVVVRAPIPEALLRRAPRLRAAIRHGAGVDMIPLAAATEAGILVANVPGTNARSVAEFAMFAALALTRRFRPIDTDLRRAGWLEGRAHADLTGELFGRRLGIVGLGAVGRAVAAIASAGFGMEVAATNRSGRPMPAPVEPQSLDALLAESDVVVLACPLTEETRGLIDARRLAAMKPDAVLINVARGPVVDEAALVAALREGRLGGAALDVFETQPLPPGHPLFELANVILTPHLAGITEPSMRRMGLGVAAEARRILAGDLPENLVNPEAGPAYRRRFPQSASAR